MSLRIKRATAKNFKRFESFDQEFGDVVKISGRNAEGKSTTLDMICSALISDGDRDLLKAGTTEGYVSLLLEDPATGETFEITRNVDTRKISDAKVKSSRVGAIPAAATFIKNVLDVVTLDPLRKVLNASEDEQRKILLETVPLVLDHHKLVDAVTGVDILNLPAVLSNSKSQEPLKAIKSVTDLVYDTRRDVNRDMKKAKAAAAQLRESAGPDPDGGRTWSEEATAVMEQLNAAQRTLAEEELAGNAVVASEERQHQNERRLSDAAIDKDINAKIEELERQRTARKTEAEEVMVAADRVTRKSANELLQKVREKWEPQITDLSTRHGAAKAKADIDIRRRVAIENAEKNEQDATAMEVRSKAMTAALSALTDIEKELLQSMPIPGLTFADTGRALLHGIPLPEKNKAEQMKFWLRIAVLRAEKRELSTVVLDNLESLDPDNWNTLVEACQESGLQFFLARMEDHEFRIENL